MRDWYEILEFDLIRQQLAQRAETPMGKHEALSLSMRVDPAAVNEALARTDEAQRIIASHAKCSFLGIQDIHEAIEKTVKRGQLSLVEVVSIWHHLQGVQHVRQFAQSFSLKNIPYFELDYHQLTIPHDLYHVLEHSLTSEDEIADDATKELHRIRRMKKQIHSDILSNLDHILKAHPDWMSEVLITTRNERYVLPIKASYKYSLGGMIHDISDSGATAFVEPEAVLHLNLQLNRLEIEEQEEINRILSTISLLVATFETALNINHEVISRLDFMFAKGAYGQEILGTIATIVEEPTIRFQNAKHPLIDPKKVVPNHFELSPEKGRFMLITGPNTGGKTVALKTIGLLVLMTQCGLAIPVTGQPQQSIFHDLFVDIGDDQSIAQSLSTFSSHMTKLIHMVDEVDQHSLVLIDEVGAGTDPMEGEALAMALFDFLHQKEATVVASTHYTNLKAFALATNYIRNASMEFSEIDLKPTYHLLDGIPGQSYAFAIAEQLGLPAQMIEKAKGYKNYYAQEHTKIMERLEHLQKELRQLEQDNYLWQTELTQKENALQTKEEKLNAKAANIEQEVQQQIQLQVEEATQTIDEIVSEIKERSQEGLKMHEWIAAKKKLREITPSPQQAVTTSEFYEGDFVQIGSMNRQGTILRKQGKMYSVLVGSMTLQVPASDLSISTAPKVEKSKNSYTGVVRPKHVPLELNIIGLRVEESLPLVDKFLDDALLVHHKQVRIIHGHGTGALRSGVHAFLKTKKFIKDFRLGGAGEGGVGATVVTLGD